MLKYIGRNVKPTAAIKSDASRVTCECWFSSAITRVWRSRKAHSRYVDPATTTTTKSYFYRRDAHTRASRVRWHRDVASGCSPVKTVQNKKSSQISQETRRARETANTNKKPTIFEAPEIHCCSQKTRPNLDTFRDGLREIYSEQFVQIIKNTYSTNSNTLK